MEDTCAQDLAAMAANVVKRIRAMPAAERPRALAKLAREVPLLHALVEDQIQQPNPFTGNAQ